MVRLSGGAVQIFDSKSAKSSKIADLAAGAMGKKRDKNTKDGKGNKDDKPGNAAKAGTMMTGNGTDRQILQGMQDEKRVIYWKQESDSKADKTFCLHCAYVVNSLWDVVDGYRWQQMATDSKVSEFFMRWKTKSASRYTLNAKDIVLACSLRITPTIRIIRRSK